MLENCHLPGVDKVKHCKVVMLLGSTKKPTTKKITLTNQDGITEDKVSLTFSKCYSLLDENKTEPIELLIFCAIEDAAEYALGEKMAPYLIAGDMTHRANDALLVADYAQEVTKGKAVRMFGEECEMLRTLLAKDNGNLDMTPEKRKTSDLSNAWVDTLPRPGKLRRTDDLAVHETIITTG